MKSTAAGLIIVAAIMVFPSLRAWPMTSPDGKGRIGAITLAFGLAFATVLDPPRRAAIKDIKKSRIKHRETADDGLSREIPEGGISQ